MVRGLTSISNVLLLVSEGVATAFQLEGEDRVQIKGKLRIAIYEILGIVATGEDFLRYADALDAMLEDV